MGKASRELITLVIAAFLAGGAAAGNAASAPADAQAQQTGTMKDLLARGGSWSCAVSRNAGNHQMQGTIFVGSGKARADFSMQTEKGPVESHMISDGGTVYMWTSMMPGSGFKMAVPAHADGATPSQPQPANPQAKMYSQSFNYNCSPWTINVAEFALPQGVSFTDMSGVIGAMKAGAKTPGTPAAAPALNCSLCDRAPQGAPRDQCRKALHCG